MSGSIRATDVPRSEHFATDDLQLQLTRWFTTGQVVSVSVNPVDPYLIMSAGNDHTARLSDLRVLSGGAASTSAPTAGA